MMLNTTILSGLSLTLYQSALILFVSLFDLFPQQNHTAEMQSVALATVEGKRCSHVAG